MNWLTLPEVKAHLRVLHDAEDDVITGMAQAAEDYVSQYLNRPVPWTDDDEKPVEVPASVRNAALLVVADLYQNRGATTSETINENPAVENLLHFYRVGLGV